MNDSCNMEQKHEMVLHFTGSPYEYVITGELGRGGSSVVYDGYYVNHTGARRPVRIRKIDVSSDEMRADARRVFDLNNELFATAGLTNRIVNTYEMHETENAVYITTTYQEGTTLDKMKPENLRDVIGAVRGLAHALEHLHAAGYLYLDIKPENVLVLEGGSDWVQLFDFDSVVSLRYTPEFAAYEQKIGDISHIGPWTDVYGVGAVLFYLLFGRPPGVLDCDDDAAYDMDGWLFGRHMCQGAGCGADATGNVDKRMPDGHTYRDGLAECITDVLHRTLARSYRDRYQSMHELAEVLDKLYADADESKMYVKSGTVFGAENIVGRSEELQFLADWLADENRPCVYVTGMGGIGKSTIVRRFAADNRNHMDVVLYLGFAGSVVETVCNDREFYINTVSRHKDESLTDYFRRKLRRLKMCLAGEHLSCVAVIDNYEPGYEEELAELINAGCRLVVVTRSENVPECYDVLRVGVLADRKDMYELMLRNLMGKKCGKTGLFENAISGKKLDSLIESVHGHTLMLTLIARQIKRGYMTIDAANELIEESGLDALDSVKTGCTIDGRLLYGHMTEFIARLFDVDCLDAVCRGVLLTLALFGDNGIYAHDLAGIADRSILNVANDLADGGWIERYGREDDWSEGRRSVRFALHPVISQAVRQMYGRCLRKDSYVETLQSTGMMSTCGHTDLGIAAEIVRRITDLLVQERMETGFRRWETYGAAVANGCLMIDGLESSGEYLTLAAQIIAGTAIESEKFILRHGRTVLERLCGCGEHHKSGFAPVSDEDLVNIADRMAHIYTDRGALQVSEKILHFLDNWSQTKEPYIKGFVFDVWTDFIDSLLGGCFIPEDDDEKELLERQMKTMNLAIKFYGQSDSASAGCRLAADLIAKATYLVRSADYEHDLARLTARREIINILNHAKQVMGDVDEQIVYFRGADQRSANIRHTDWQNVQLNHQNRHAYFMAKAWFYTYIEPDIQRAERSIRSAQKIYENSCESELDLINYLMIPAANVYLELDDKDKCLKWLGRAVKVCEKNGDLAAFVRKREELREIMESEGL